MTCLYCGKKLGFFSRYKDTPFCSEEHLRTHQDELERALMERLGSKGKTPAKSLNDLAEAEPPPVRSTLGGKSALHAPESISAPAPPLAATTAAPEPVPAPAKADPPKSAAPAPLNEEYLLELPQPVAALELEKPLIPPSAFAIIIQADCCTPQLPPIDPAFALHFEHDEFPIESVFSPHAATASEFLQPYLNQQLVGLYLKLLVSISGAPTANSIEYPWGDLVSLDYETGLSPLGYTALGHRDAVPPHPRLRYPYAASQVSSTWNLLPVNEDSFLFTASDDWAPVLPSSWQTLQPNAALLPESNLPPVQEVPLSIAALTNYTLPPASAEDFGDSLTVYARTLSHAAGLAASFPNGEWAPRIARPHAATCITNQPRWLKARHPNRVPPIPFPSLFLLGPVLPPRPESTVS